jgi:hypothetical protein
MNWKPIVTMLMLGLALGALTIEVKSGGKPSPVVRLDAASVYPAELVFTASKLTHTAPGYSPGYGNLSGITWDYSTVSVDLSSFWPGYYLGRIDRVDIRYGKNAAGQIVSVRVEGIESIPGARDIRFHDTPWLPVLNGPVTIDPVNGYTLHIRWDNIPVYRHTSWKSNSPVETIAGYMSLGDLVITPRP